jgi:hypothetical protein
MLSNKGSQSKLVGAEKFWRGHYEAQKLSQLSRKAYCKQNGISYSQFSYWAGKWNQNYVGKLIPVGVKGKINSKWRCCIIQLITKFLAVNSKVMQ